MKLLKGLLLIFANIWADTEGVVLGRVLRNIVVSAHNSAPQHEFHAHEIYINICFEQEAGHLIHFHKYTFLKSVIKHISFQSYPKQSSDTYCIRV
jgi:hypothetical protein